MMSTTTVGNKEYYYKIPFTEVNYGYLHVCITANTEDEADKAVMEQNYDLMEEIDWEVMDSEPMDTIWRERNLTSIVCKSCGTTLPWSENDCECSEGWNDPDITTPDKLYGTAS